MLSSCNFICHQKWNLKIFVINDWLISPNIIQNYLHRGFKIYLEGLQLGLYCMIVDGSMWGSAVTLRWEGCHNCTGYTNLRLYENLVLLGYAMPPLLKPLLSQLLSCKRRLVLYSLLQLMIFYCPFLEQREKIKCQKAKVKSWEFNALNTWYMLKSLKVATHSRSCRESNTHKRSSHQSLSGVF